MNLVETLVASPDTFSTLVTAVTRAGLADTLSGPGPFTVFAPTDATFEAALMALGLAAEEALALPNLAQILKFHVARGKLLGTPPQ